MDKETKTRNAIILCIVVVILASLIVLLYKLKSKDLEYESFLKNYKVNEYIPAYISDEAMARIYFNDYLNIMFTEREKAFYLLDEEYRTKRFGSYEVFNTYVESLKYEANSMTKYYKTDKSGYVIFGVYDDQDNLYIFKTKGVMQYSVYLDDYTVEIG